ILPISGVMLDREADGVAGALLVQLADLPMAGEVGLGAGEEGAGKSVVAVAVRTKSAGDILAVRNEAVIAIEDVFIVLNGRLKIDQGLPQSLQSHRSWPKLQEV